MYAMLYTRRAIALVVSVMSRYQANIGEEYWIAIKNIFKYLRRTKDLFLIFDEGLKLKVEGYIDLDIMFDVNDRRSTSECIFLCNGGLVSWKSFKQPVIADSTMKVEYIATSEAAKKAYWFKKFVAKLGVMPSDVIALHCDNNSAMALAKEPKSH